MHAARVAMPATWLSPAPSTTMTAAGQSLESWFNGRAATETVGAMVCAWRNSSRSVVIASRSPPIKFLKCCSPKRPRLSAADSVIHLHALQIASGDEIVLEYDMARSLMEYQPKRPCSVCCLTTTSPPFNT